MTICIGDRFREDSGVLTVYGFRTDDDAECGRLILIADAGGNRAAIEPWTLIENCALEPCEKPMALPVFDSKVHGTKANTP